MKGYKPKVTGVRLALAGAALLGSMSPGCGAPPADGEEVEVAGGAVKVIVAAATGDPLHFKIPAAFKTGPVRAYVGKEHGQNRHEVLFRYVGSGPGKDTCISYVVGDANGLAQDTFVDLGPLGDSVEVPAGDSGATAWCLDPNTQQWSTVVFDGVRQNDHYLFVNGGDGDDYMSCSGAATVCFGEGGNDTMLSWGSDATLSGGPGNDKLFAYAPGPHLGLLGGAGSDCLQILDWSSGLQPRYYDSGDGDVDLCFQRPSSGCDHVIEDYCVNLN
jgi:Ca2+-binding RTX toxin-like protein